MAYHYSLIAYMVLMVCLVGIVLIAISLSDNVPTDYRTPIYNKIPNNQYDYEDHTLSDYEDYDP